MTCRSASITYGCSSSVANHYARAVSREAVRVLAHGACSVEPCRGICRDVFETSKEIRLASKSVLSSTSDVVIVVVDVDLH